MVSPADGQELFPANHHQACFVVRDGRPPNGTLIF
jgi:hypothetical protein